MTIDGEGSLAAVAHGGAAIGGNYSETVGAITINGGKINATSANGAGIGLGLYGRTRDIVIGGDAQVTATATSGESSNVKLGIAASSSRTITISGDDSTETKSNVVINNADASTAVTINGRNFTNPTLKFVDGEIFIDKEFLISEGGEYKLDENLSGTTITIATTDAVILNGGDYQLADVKIIASVENVDVTIENLNVKNNSGSVIQFGGGENKLTITGENILATNFDGAAVDVGDSLEIIGVGTLAATNSGAAIGGSGNLTIGGDAQVTVTSTNGAGLATSGTITLTDDTSTSETCSVVISNANNTAATTINGANYRGTKLDFFDGTCKLTITEGGTYEILSSSMEVVIETDDAVILQGDSSELSNVKISASVENANLTIKNLNVTNESNSVIQFGGGENKLTITGENILAASGNFAAVNVGNGDLAISGEGSLNATAVNGAAVGGDRNSSAGNIYITGGTITATATNGGAGIGRGYSTVNTSTGDIYIGGDAQVIASTSGGETEDAKLGIKVSDGKTITFGGDTSTETKSKVVVNNANSQQTFTVNGKNYTGQSLAFVDGEFTSTYTITEGGEYTLDESKNVVIATTDAVILNGNGNELSGVKISARVKNIDLTIENLQIKNVSGSVLDFSGKKNKLTITGENSLTTSDKNAAINFGNGIEILGTGTLVAENSGAAIGGDGNISIGGDVNFIATSTEGIGVEISGAITISDDAETSDANNFIINSVDSDTALTINKKTYSGANLNFVDGAAYISSDYVIVSGGEYVLAESLTYSTIIISTSEPVTLHNENSDVALVDVTIKNLLSPVDLTIDGVNIENQTGNAISFVNAAGNKLTISGTNNLATTRLAYAAINVGSGVTILGDGILNATATSAGAAIGSDFCDVAGDISITGGTINATATSGAAVGGGEAGTIGAITITGTAKVNATSTNGAAIGRGLNSIAGSSFAGDILISGDAQVTATATGTEESDVKLAIATSDEYTITLSGDTSTSTTSAVIINNADAETSVKINGQEYSGSTLKFVDDVPLLEITAGGEYTLTENNLVVTVSTSDPVTLTGDGSALSDVQISATTTARRFDD